MKRIFFLVPKIYGGGIEKALLDIIRNLDQNKYEISVIYLLGEGIEYLPLVEKYANVKIIFKKSNKKLINIFQMGVRWALNSLPPVLQWKIIVNKQYDVEIAYAHGLTTRIISGSKNKSKKYAWIHNDISDMKLTYFPVTEKMMHNSYKKYNAVCAVSEAAGKAFEKRYQLSSLIQPNVVDLSDIIEKSEAYKSKKASEFTIVSVGRLEKIKGFDRLLRVHKRLIDEGIENTVCIIGEGTQRHELQAYIDENDLTQTAKLLGFQENPYPCVKSADLFVCSSLHEGISLALCEAIVLDVPVVTTRVCGSIELFGDSEYGVVVDNDEEALYCGIKEMVTRAETYQYYKQKIRERKQLFDKEQIVRKFEKLIEDFDDEE